MSTFLISFVIVALAIVGLAAGLLMGRAPLRGSCGGIGSGCACTTPCPRRRSPRRQPEPGD